MNLLKNIFSTYNEKTHKVVCILGLKIKTRNLRNELELLREELKTELKNEFNDKIDALCKKEKLNRLRIKKLLPVNSIKTIELHIVDHCNLNCKGCHHFAPLAPESYLSLSEFESDLTRLFELTNGDIETFNILGGEPLLHPQCIDFLEMARRIFPKSNIKLITNGILLPEMPDSFYERCGKSNILLQPTNYFLDMDWDLIKEKCKHFGVDFCFYLENKFMYKDMVDLTASQDPVETYLNCKLEWNEIFYLDHGKIYHCGKEAYMKFFSDYFEQNIKIPETDYIDIYKVKNVQEIFDFMIRPPKFCSHCIRTKPLTKYQWEKSKREISEWTEV